MKPFSKPYLPVPAQIALLKARGLTITDDGRAAAALERIGYYRLSGYWYPLRTSSITSPGGTRVVHDNFRPGSEFGQIVDLVSTLPAAPGISVRHMGFQKDWSDLPLWRNV